MRIVIALVVWVAAVVGAVAVSSQVAGSIHTTPAASFTPGAAGATSGSTGSSSAPAAPDPSSIKSTDSASLFRTANLERALSKARSALGARAQIEEFVVYPGYLSVIAATGSGETVFYADANGRVVRTNSAGNAGDATLSLARISAGVPAALVHRIATQAHVPESQLHYVVADADPVSGKLEFLVYPVQGSPVEYFKASGVGGTLLEYRNNSSAGPQPVPGRG